MASACTHVHASLRRQRCQMQRKTNFSETVGCIHVFCDNAMYINFASQLARATPELLSV